MIGLPSFSRAPLASVFPGGSRQTFMVTVAAHHASSCLEKPNPITFRVFAWKRGWVLRDGQILACSTSAHVLPGFTQSEIGVGKRDCMWCSCMYTLTHWTPCISHIVSQCSTWDLLNWVMLLAKNVYSDIYPNYLLSTPKWLLYIF